MALTEQEKKALNTMCPAAQAVSLGDKVDDFVQGVLTAGSVGTAELADDAVTKEKVAADVAGSGLAQDTDGSLMAVVDDSTLEIAEVGDPAVDTLQVKDGGITSGKLAAALQALVLGAASGYTLARGEAAVTGTADVDTGLATVVAVVACLGSDPSVDALWASAAPGGTAGHIDLKVWKPTASDNCTPIAATAEKSVEWIALGT